jgi:hypothetical protein
VTQAGYFTVLKPSGGSSASRLPGSLQDLVGQPKKAESLSPASAPGQKTLDRVGSPATTAPLQILGPDASDHHPVRLLLIILAAVALTLAVLWWMTPVSPWGK